MKNKKLSLSQELDIALIEAEITVHEPIRFKDYLVFLYIQVRNKIFFLKNKNRLLGGDK